MQWRIEYLGSSNKKQLPKARATCPTVWILWKISVEKVLALLYLNVCTLVHT